MAQKEQATANRNYKDTVFRMLFSDRQNLLSLYNAVSGSHYDDPEMLEIVTLENALAAKLTIEISPRALGHKHHALGLKVAKEPLTQTVQALVRQARPQVGDSLLGAMKCGGVGMIGFNAART